MTFNPNLITRARSRIVKDWRTRLRDFSTISLALGTALQGAWLIFPEDLKTSLPSKWISYGLAAILLWGLVGKFIVQGDPAQPSQGETK